MEGGIGSQLIVAVDVGNTRIKFGIFRDNGTSLPTAEQITACVAAQDGSPQDELSRWLAECAVQFPELHTPNVRALIAGSDPETRDALLDNWPVSLVKPEVVTSYRQVPVELDVESPDRVGIDRLLNVWAAWRMTLCRDAVIAVDSGTATTVDLLTQDGVFRGGSILPGLRLSAFAMHDYTARLPLLNMDNELTDAPELPGRNTEAAMRAGLFYGQLGAVRELAAGLTAFSVSRLGQSDRPRVFVSGGGGRQLVRFLPDAQFVDSLALHGLAMLGCAKQRESMRRSPH
ncbi:MAG: type III pantothenate kinase [Planctomyces sp.]|nr:type III pantothenate kinase [Planctomyces sp.]